VGTLRTCDKCKGAGFTLNDVQRYSVRRYVANPAGRKNQGTFQSAGSIDLCDKCWSAICKPRMRPHGNYRANAKSFAARNQNAS